MADVSFSKIIEGLGEVQLRPLYVPDDIQTIQQWLNQSYAHYWGMLESSFDEIADFYQNLNQSGHSLAYLGFYQGEPAFLVECYDPKHDQVSEHYDVQPGDQGMHILLAPPKQKIPNFSYHIFCSVMDFVFSLPNVKRVVVEPDHRNHKIHTLNKRAGFHHERVIQMGEKTAYLAFCTKQQYALALLQEQSSMSFQSLQSQSQLTPQQAVEVIKPDVWAKVNRYHVRKAISELAHERVITPEKIGEVDQWQSFRLETDNPDVHYLFNAQIMALNHWYIDAQSIMKYEQGEQVTLDSVRFVLDFAPTLKIAQDKLPIYLEEISSTLYSAAFKEEKDFLTAEALTKATFQEVETSMSEGHPSFIANNGRIGFDAQDYVQYAPEAASPMQLIWVAAHQRRAHFSVAEDISYDALFEQELDITLREHFNQQIRDAGADPKDYVLIPVHPWQWFNKLVHIFASDIAAKDLICVGYGEDQYFAQQSIRTFFNISNPSKFYVKTALSILNMGFMRGLSAYYMSATPAINDWVNELIQSDAYFEEVGFSVIRELAAVGYRQPYYEHKAIGNSPYNKMLSALWRENPMNRLKEGERLMTMASLLHVDPNGNGVLPAMITSSGLTTDAWLKQYFSVYMKPLLHCFYQYQLVFMPHGENLILQFENNVPVKAIMKDIGEEVCLMDTSKSLPELVQRIACEVPDDIRLLSIFTDVFDGIFRYLSQILYAEMEYPQEKFWACVAEVIREYQEKHPHLQEQFDKFDLFAPEFALSCLNRLQLGNNLQMVDLTDPANSLKFAGNLDNPVALFQS